MIFTKIDLKGKIDIDWGDLHREHLDHWNSRAQHLFVTEIGASVSDGYYNWYSSITLRYITRIGGGHCYTMDLLDHIESVYKGEKVGDIPGIIAYAKRVLQDQFSSGYYQDFPFDERCAKEVQLKGKPKQHPKGGCARVNPPRRRGVLPNVHGETHVDEDRGDPMQDKIDVHLDDDIEDEAETREARDLSFCPRWNLLPSNNFVLISPPCEHTKQVEVNQSPPLSHPTFFLFTQSQDPLAEQPHSPVNQQQQAPLQHALLQENQPPLQTTTHQQEAHQQSELQQPPQEQLALQQPAHKLPIQKLRLRKLPTQKQPAEQLPAKKLPVQKKPVNQLAAQQQEAQQQPALQHPAEQLLEQQEAPREQLHMKLRARKHAPPGCGTVGKKELDTYKRRNKD